MFHQPPQQLWQWLSTVKSLGVATFFWLCRGVRNSSEMLPNPTFSTMNSSNYYLDLRILANENWSHPHNALSKFSIFPDILFVPCAKICEMISVVTHLYWNCYKKVEFSQASENSFGIMISFCVQWSLLAACSLKFTVILTARDFILWMVTCSHQNMQELENALCN